MVDGFECVGREKPLTGVLVEIAVIARLPQLHDTAAMEVLNGHTNMAWDIGVGGATCDAAQRNEYPANFE